MLPWIIYITHQLFWESQMTLIPPSISTIRVWELKIPFRFTALLTKLNIQIMLIAFLCFKLCYYNWCSFFFYKMRGAENLNCLNLGTLMARMLENLKIHILVLFFGFIILGKIQDFQQLLLILRESQYLVLVYLFFSGPTS